MLRIKLKIGEITRVRGELPLNEGKIKKKRIRVPKRFIKRSNSKASFLGSIPTNIFSPSRG